MFKKLVVGMFIISMLFIVSCSEDQSSDPDVTVRLTDEVISNYNPETSTWEVTNDWIYSYDENDRVDALVDNLDGMFEELTYSSLSDVRPLEFISGIPEISFNMKAHFTYEEGKTKELLLSISDSLGVYSEALKMEYTYENGMLVSNVQSFNIGAWMELGAENWIYESGKLVEYIRPESQRIVYTYINDRLFETFEYDWNGKWDLLREEEFTYEDGLLKEKLLYDNPQSKAISGKKTYEYSGNHLISINEYSWNDISSDFEKYSKNEFAYDGDWNVLSEIESFWDLIEEVYVFDGKVEFTYENESGNYIDIDKAMSPNKYYTGMTDSEMIHLPMPSKNYGNDKIKKIMELLEKRR